MIDREIDTSGPDAPIETVETRYCIASDQAEGAPVYGPDRAKIGYVHNFMIDKRSWKVAYVIISDKGFLGLGAFQYMRVSPGKLNYDDELGGYVTDIKAEILQHHGRTSVDDAELQVW